MTTTNGHPLVERYLARLDAAARRLPRGERRELVDEIRAHLDAGIGPDPAEADVRNVLDDLGDPDEIVAAARPATSPTAAPGPNGWVALVLGILSLLVIMVPFAPVVLGGGAVVLGVATRRRARSTGRSDGPATAGVLIGTLAASTGIVALLFLLGVSSSISADDGVQPVRPPGPVSPTTSEPAPAGGG